MADKPKPKGRPVIRKVEIDASVSEIAQAIFRAAKKPDPNIQVTKKSRNWGITLLHGARH